MKTIDSALAFDQSDIAKFRLHCVELLASQGWKRFHQAFPQVGRRTVYRWQQQYQASNKRLVSLIPRSTRPHQVRQMIIPAKILGFLRVLRQQYPKLSKYKLKLFLDEYCREEGLTLYSVSWIGKVISRHHLFFNHRQPVRSKARMVSKHRIKYCPKVAEVALGYLQLDGVVVVFESKAYKFLTAVELSTRQAFVRRVTSFSSQATKAFLESIQTSTPYRIHTVQTDNGSEFGGKFDQSLETITHLWSRPRKPKTQGFVERFNWTLQDEFVNYSIDQASVDLAGFDRALRDWLIYYNTKRPHQGLNYQTPHQALQYQLQFTGATESAKCV